jgi:tetratricopeptide (TPR) repeat protein
VWERKHNWGKTQGFKNRCNTCYVQDNYARAIAYYQQGGASTKGLENHHSKAQVLKNRGKACYAQGSYAKAIAYYEQRQHEYKMRN